jgi:TetR/AcrR family fatty acid metabolism transcriptional regulator
VSNGPRPRRAAAPSPNAAAIAAESSLAAGPDLLFAGRLTPSTLQGESTRKALIEAALAEFASRGYAGARVQQITQRAGVGYGTFYKYFSSKRDLVRAVMREVYDDIFANAMAETHSSRPVAERAYIDILASIRSFYRHRETLRVLDRAIGVDPELTDYLARLQERDVCAYADILATVPGYDPRGDPYVVSLAVNSLVDEVARRWIHSPEATGDPARVEPRMAEMARLLTQMALSVVTGSPVSAG